MADTES